MSSYATTADFDVHGIRPEALPAGITSDTKAAAITAASGRADSYLGARFRLPLASWGDDLKQVVCKLAAYELVATLLVFQPDPATNAVLVDRKNDAVRWLESVAANKATPTGIVDSAPVASSVARVYSSTKRGW